MLPEEHEGLLDDECGVAAIIGHENAPRLTALALHGLQHRGQESVGISVRDADRDLRTLRRMGKVSEVITEADLAEYPGNTTIGHVRYSTAGGSILRNAQPIYVDLKFGPIAIAHNGNLTNVDTLRRALEAQGSIFHSTSDTEVIAHLIARSTAASLDLALLDALQAIEGAFSLVVLTRDHVYAARDRFGVRPLSLGRKDNAWVVASETCALDLIRAQHERDVEPGELVRIPIEGNGEVTSRFPFQREEPAPCIFELVYFSRPDSTTFGRGVYRTRVALGEELASTHPVEADVVVPVPDSGVPAALGFARASGIPYELGLIRSHYIGRTFIEPTPSLRDLSVKLKLSPVGHVLNGKRVIVVDDSIVRGTTSRNLIALIREAGAVEVHVRIASAPTRWPCFYGIDTPKRDQLIAATHSIDSIRDFIGADSLAYLEIEGMRRACGITPEAAMRGERFCEACFTGAYPVPLLDSEATPATSV